MRTQQEAVMEELKDNETDAMIRNPTTGCLEKDKKLEQTKVTPFEFLQIVFKHFTPGNTTVWMLSHQRSLPHPMA